MLITDIGEDDASVLCMTNKSDCCRRGDGGATRGVGEWYFPDGSVVGIEDEGRGGSFYRDRSLSVVRLHRRNNVLMPTGSFCCEVPDTNNVNQRLCIMVKAIEPFQSKFCIVHLTQLNVSILIINSHEFTISMAITYYLFSCY